MRAQATQLNASVLSGGTRPHRARRQHSKRERPFLWFAPVILLLLAVTLYPTALVIWISFQKTRFYALGLPLYPLDRTGVRMSGAVAGSTRGLPVAGTVAVLWLRPRPSSPSAARAYVVLEGAQFRARAGSRVAG